MINPNPACTGNCAFTSGSLNIGSAGVVFDKSGNMVSAKSNIHCLTCHKNWVVETKEGITSSREFLVE